MMDDAWVLEAAVHQTIDEFDPPNEKDEGLKMLAEAFVKSWLSRLDTRFDGLEGMELRIARYGAISAVNAWIEHAVSAANHMVTKQGISYHKGIMWACTRQGVMTPNLETSLARRYIEEVSGE